MANLVLLHGITENHRAWDPVAQRLQAAGHRVLAPDLHGHGAARGAPPYDLNALATHAAQAIVAAGLDPAQCVVVGHSLGGMVATALATAMPLRAVVNVDQPLRLAAFKAGLAQLAPLLRGDAASFRAAIQMVFDSMRGPLSAAETARIEALRQPDQAVVMGIWDSVIDSPEAELNALVDGLAAGVKLPYLALHGIDPGPEYAAWLKQAVPSSTLEVWPDHGHYPHLVDPERFVQRLQAFVAAG